MSQIFACSHDFRYSHMFNGENSSEPAHDEGLTLLLGQTLYLSVWASRCSAMAYRPLSHQLYSTSKRWRSTQINATAAASTGDMTELTPVLSAMQTSFIQYRITKKREI